MRCKPKALAGRRLNLALKHANRSEERVCASRVEALLRVSKRHRNIGLAGHRRGLVARRQQPNTHTGFVRRRKHLSIERVIALAARIGRLIEITFRVYT